jgi:molybdopterin/thiamine biosynthesis adenylyltransferase
MSVSASRSGNRPETRAANLESVINRYDRQELIQGWDQRKLTGSSVMVVGSDILAQYVMVALSALGFGYTEFYGTGTMEKGDYSKGFIRDNHHGFHKVEMISAFAQKLNPLIVANGIALDLSRSKNLSVLQAPQVIFDATNDSASKIELLEYAIANKSLFISLSSTGNVGKLGVYNPDWRKNRQEALKIMNNVLFHDMDGKEQDPFTGMMISALAADEARKYLMPIGEEKVIEDVIIHNLYSHKRFDAKSDKQILDRENALSGKKVLMVGAGGLGNPVGLGLSMTDIEELFVIDKDVVESTNLNRQPLFYDSVGKNKVPALISQLKKINPKISYTGLAEFIDLEYHTFFRRNKFDLIIDCVDNDKTRALLNYYSLKYEIPLISSATRFDSGHVNASIPGKTSCLNCQREIDKYALDAHERTTAQNASCIYAPQASVITSNMAIAGMVIAETLAILDPEKYSDPLKYELKYVSREDFRVGALPVNNQQCKCYQNSRKLEDWPDKMKHLYKKPRE